MAAIMMDYDITDAQGNTHKLLDPKTQKLPPFEVIGGVLEVKEEFKDSFKVSDLTDLTLKIEKAVSSTQGNYNPFDIMFAKKFLWGKGLTLFKTWQMEHFNQRWGTKSSKGEVNLNINTQKQTFAGRNIRAAKASPLSFAAYTAGSLSIAYGSNTLIGLATGSITAGAILYRMKHLSTDESMNLNVGTVQDLTSFLTSTVVEALNFPARMGSSTFLRHLKIDNSTFQKSSLSAQEIGSLKALSRDLGFQLNMLAFKLAIYALAYDDDDKFRYKFNFVQNLLSRNIENLGSYTQPGAFITDNGALMFLREMGEIQASIQHLVALDPKKSYEHWLKQSMLPKPLRTKEMFFEQKYLLDEMQEMKDFPSPLNWTYKKAKDDASGGEYKAKGSLRDMKKDLREEIDLEYKKVTNGSKSALTLIAKEIIKRDLGHKGTKDNYKKALENYKKTGRITSKKFKKATKSERNTFKNKLKERTPLTNAEIAKVMAKLFKGR